MNLVKGEKHLGWAIKTIYNKQNAYHWTLCLNKSLKLLRVLDETAEEGRLFHTKIVLGENEFFRASL